MRTPDTLEDLKFVLATIADIRDMSLVVEMRYRDIQERYRTLTMYNIEVGRCSKMTALAFGRFMLTVIVVMKSAVKQLVIVICINHN